MDADSFDSTQLKHHFGADTTPDLPGDGTRIVWRRVVPDGNHIWTMDADGTNQRRITTYPGSYEYPRWSPDGQRLLFVSDGRLSTVKADGSDLRKVFEDPAFNIRSASWAPDGTRVVIDIGLGTRRCPGPVVSD